MRLFLLGFLLVAGPALADVRASPTPPTPPALPLSVWRAAGPDRVEHLQSGLVCPAKIDRYTRTRLEFFDKFGLDVGCNYAAPTTDITLYMTRRSGAGLDDAMAEAKRELLQMGAARNPKFVSETRSQANGLDWTTALYSEDGGLHTSIWIADLDSWTFEYRVTNPAGDDAAVGLELKTISALVRGSAGARLALCGKSPPPERPARAPYTPEDARAASMMTSILGGAAVAAVAQGKQAPEPPPSWCAEGMITKEGHNMLFWRAVNADGSDGRSDQITLMTQEAPPTLDISADSLASFVEDVGKGSNKPLRWVATLKAGEQTLIFGYFEGRPSQDAASDLFARILDGKAKPVGGYGAKGKNITITLPSTP